MGDTTQPAAVSMASRYPRPLAVLFRILLCTTRHHALDPPRRSRAVFRVRPGDHPPAPGQSLTSSSPAPMLNRGPPPADEDLHGRARLRGSAEALQQERVAPARAWPPSQEMKRKEG